MKFESSFKTHVDVVKLKVGDDGTPEDRCWFCGGAIATPGEGELPDLAMLTIVPVGGGERVATVCHKECARRAKGSLAIGP